MVAMVRHVDASSVHEGIVELGHPAWGSVFTQEIQTSSLLAPRGTERLGQVSCPFCHSVSDRSEAQFLHILNRNARCAGAAQCHDPGAVLGPGQGPAGPRLPASGGTRH